MPFVYVSESSQMGLETLEVPEAGAFLRNARLEIGGVDADVGDSFEGQGGGGAGGVEGVDQAEDGFGSRHVKGAADDKEVSETAGDDVKDSREPGVADGVQG